MLKSSNTPPPESNLSATGTVLAGLAFLAVLFTAIVFWYLTIPIVIIIAIIVDFRQKRSRRRMNHQVDPYGDRNRDQVARWNELRAERAFNREFAEILSSTPPHVSSR